MRSPRKRALRKGLQSGVLRFRVSGFGFCEVIPILGLGILRFWVRDFVDVGFVPGLGSISGRAEW